MDEIRRNPADLETIAPRVIRLWWVIMISLSILFAWAAIFTIDVVSSAEGTVVPFSRLQKVQHLEGGIVRELLVKEGQMVTKGQLLVRLEPTQSNADFGEVDAHLTTLKADQLRLEAESSGARSFTLPKDFSNNHPDVATRTEKLFQARRDTLQSSLSIHERAIAEISARLKHTRSRYELAVEQVAIGQKLIGEGLSNRYEQIEREKEATSLMSRIREDEQALAKAQFEMTSERNKYDQEVRKDLSEARRQIEEMGNRETKFKDAVYRTDLKAPMAGIVKVLYINNVGAVVPAGGTLLDLVPDGDRMVVEAHLPPQDVGYVKAGQKAVIQLASADATRLGRIDGHVVNVSPDSVTDKDGKVSYYIVKVETSKSYFGSEEQRYPLSPGVQVTVGILTGQRTVLGYLLYPVLRSMPFALGER